MVRVLTLGRFDIDKRIFYGVRSRVEETDNCTNTTTKTDIITRVDTMVLPSNDEAYL